MFAFCDIAVICDNDLTLGVIKRPHKPIQTHVYSKTAKTLLKKYNEELEVNNMKEFRVTV